MDTKPEQQAEMTERLAPIRLVPNRLRPNKLAPIRLVSIKAVALQGHQDWCRAIAI